MVESWRDWLLAAKFPARRVELALEGLAQTAAQREEIRWRSGRNQLKVLQAFHSVGLSESALGGTSGYGYGDYSRECLDRVVASIFGAEAGLLRLQFVSGTHAIAAGLFGWLRPGQELVSLTGAPYDTLLPVIGTPGHEQPGSLREFGIGYRQLDLTDRQSIDLEAIGAFLNEQTGAVFLQRSRGYTERASLSIRELGEAIARVRAHRPDCLILVDNCYGELVELQEPTEVGADLVAGSLIKNLGGAVATTGGYLAGTRRAVERAATRLTAPGIGAEMGPTLGLSRQLAQGLWLAPVVVGQALEGAIWASWMLQAEGYLVSPGPGEPRTDLIQSVRLGSEAHQRAFCRGVQRAGPVDSQAVPTPVNNPGYRDPIVMAGGTLVAGSSLELSADGPIRPPYACYLQGGVHLAQVVVGVLSALGELDSL